MNCSWSSIENAITRKVGGVANAVLTLMAISLTWTEWPLTFVQRLEAQDVDDTFKKPKEKNPAASESESAPTKGWQRWPVDAPKPAIAPFDDAKAKQHQQKWAKYVGVPVEYTNSINMKFHIIPPGEFLMGSTRDEIASARRVANQTDANILNRIKSEAPQHRVILTQPVYLGTCEVTQAQFEAITGKNPSRFSKGRSGASFVKESTPDLNTADHPVEEVTWHDAREFCSLLEKKEEQHLRERVDDVSRRTLRYRLPTEAEWEFACRAGTTTTYWTGNKPDSIRTAGNFGSSTQKVGKFKSNPFGLYDVYGNVNEWCFDWWEVSSYRSHVDQPAIDPVGPANDKAVKWRTFRGGSLYDSPIECRSGSRKSADPTSTHSTNGFRVVLTIKHPFDSDNPN